MSKYIVEIKPEYEDSFKGLMILGAKDSNIFVDMLAVEELEELNAEYINNHFPDITKKVDEAYQRGLEDAWKTARRISVLELSGGLTGNEMMKIYGTMDLHKIYDDNTASEAIEKLKAYEEKQKADEKIKVGDEVIYNGTTKCIVVRPEDDERYASLIDCDGTHYSADHRECKKTGRHFDIEKILEAMKE